MRIAISGGTGFVGSHLIEAATIERHEVRALARRPQPAVAGVTWVTGALDDPASLAELVHGAEAVIHVAGVTKGSREEMLRGNVAGTEAMLEARAAAGIGRFVHVSSLAAREPKLSAYGWSKCAAEEPVIASGGAWTIVRPPAVYGPRDTEMLELFRAARLGIVPLPSDGRLSVIAAQDLAALLLACVTSDACVARTYEPDDGLSEGWSQRDFAHALGEAVGRRVRTLRVPRGLLRVAAAADTAVRRASARLTPDRAAYFAHPDWVARAGAQPPPELWRPRIETRAGLAETAAWYRAEGWLKR